MDAQKTSPYDFYQYWINVDDADVKKLLLSLTDLPVEKIDELTAESGPQIVRAKQFLAYAITASVHGEAAANDAQSQSKAAFGGGNNAEMPEREVELEDDTVICALVAVGFAPSKGAARRLIEGGGVSVDGVKVGSPDEKVPSAAIKRGSFTLFKGKKQRLRVKIAGK